MLKREEKHGLGSARRAAKLLCLAAAAAVSLAGCQALPGEGPGAGKILATAGKSAAEQGKKNTGVYDVIEINESTSQLLSTLESQTFSSRFSMTSGAGGAVFGVGDTVRIIIFEAGDNGLFSNTQTKQITLDLLIQPDGTVPVPYAGSVRLAGRTAEQARASILARLRGRAVEPDAIVTATGTQSRVVTVSGAVGASAQVPLTLQGDRLLDVIAKAGGPANAPYESYVTLTRGGKTGTMLLKSLIENPRNNVFVRPGDSVFVTYDPRTFTVVGETVADNRIPFGSNDLNLLEAIALAGGGKAETVDAKGYFVFRFEDYDILCRLLGEKRVADLIAKGLSPDKQGRYPIVYRLDLATPASLLSGQKFPMKNRDVVYASKHPAVDVERFVKLVAEPLGVVTVAARLGTTR